jgi:class 3 adenylate cyclase/tetratricopeptide (TPR) repeat protein
MKCPKCQFANPAGVNFCVECGGKLEKICPACGHRNFLSHKFCGGCGHQLSLPIEALSQDLSFDAKLTKIQRYLPQGLTEKILSQKDRIEGERKQVTVMVCDMEGYTELAETLGPEKTYAVMDKVYELLIRKVNDFGGTVNELTGDGIMALFGAPRALEDAPQRAIRSAMAIHSEMSRISEILIQEQPNIKPVKIRIGIHTGPVVVGSLGSDLRVEFKAVGDTVNLASRMEGLAQPGSTYVSEKTFKLSEGLFRFEILEEKPVKGKKDLIKFYRVISPSSRRTRFDVSADRGLTPLVGRERELELLLDCYEKAKRGSGNAVSIVSDAGVGKSRLLYEFRKSLANENITFLEGKCLSYGKSEIYQPVIDILKSIFDLRDDDNTPTIKNKIENRINSWQLDNNSTLPYIHELLSIKDPDVDPISLSPEAKKEGILAAISALLIRASESRTLILAIEDLHWIDTSSEELSKYLLESIVGSRVLLIFTYRTEYTPIWRTKSYHSTISLNRLSNRQSIEILTFLLGSDKIDYELESFVLDKTEGVPFFIEEFVKSLNDLDLIVRDHDCVRLQKVNNILDVPVTIHDVIMSRVDSLPENLKSLLQIGSIIEREFSYELLEKISGLDRQELKADLSKLVELELLYPRGTQPDESYVFKHALIQEVVYNSLLTPKRRALHGVVGQAIEDLKKENIDEYYGTLAKHFIENENFGKGAEYSSLAAKRSIRAASFIEAFDHAKRCVACLEELPDNIENTKKIIHARTVLANYYLTLIYLNEAKQTVDVIVDKAHQINYREQLPRIYTVIGVYNLLVKEDFTVGCQYLANAIEISEEVSDFLSSYFANFYLGWGLSFDCQFDKAEEYLKRSYDLSAVGNHQLGMTFSKGVMSTATYNFSGKVEHAYTIGQDLVNTIEKSPDIFLQGMAYSSFGASCYFKGCLDKAEKNLLKGIAYSEKTTQVGWKAWTCFYLGEIHLSNQRYSKAIEYYQKGIDTLKSVGILPSAIAMYRISLARANVLNKQTNISLSKLAENYQSNQLNALTGWGARYIGEIFLNLEGQPLSKAEEWARRAVAANKKHKMLWLLGHDYMLLAKIMRRKGNASGAAEFFRCADRILTDCGADEWVSVYEKELNDIR